MSREVTVKIISVHLPIILSVVSFDQAAKYFVVGRAFTTSCNVGFAFGIFPFSNLLSATLTFFVLGLVGYLLIRIVILRPKAEESNTVFGLALIFGGGLSNLIDRFTRGCVVDFISAGRLASFLTSQWRSSDISGLAKLVADIDFKIWPAFNLADAAITIGVGILLVSFFRKGKNA